MFSQTTLAWQIVIIDDGSNSNTQAEYQSVIRQYDAYKLVEYVKLPNKMGANHARNVGVNLATGNVIAFLDDDDIWFDHYLASQLQNLEKYPQAVAQVCGFSIMSTNEMKTNEDRQISETSLREGNQFCGMSGVMAKREILLQYPFDESLQNGQDWDLFVTMVANGELITNIARPLFCYRKNTPKGVSAITKNMMVEESDARLASAFKHREWLGEYHFRRRVAEQLLTFLQHKPNKLKWLAKSIRLSGLKITLIVLIKKLIR